MATTNSIAKPSSEPAVKTAKLFKNGRSQAVRLPKEFRFEGTTEVVIRRDEASGVVVLSPPAEITENSRQDHLTERNALTSPGKDVLERSQTTSEKRDFPKTEQLASGSDSARKLTLPELYAIFDQADYPDDFFKREVHMPRELDLFE
jgi:virulence-associated protein VagC